MYRRVHRRLCLISIAVATGTASVIGEQSLRKTSCNNGGAISIYDRDDDGIGERLRDSHNKLNYLLVTLHSKSRPIEKTYAEDDQEEEASHLNCRGLLPCAATVPY